jgi:hypothetical protein
MAWLSGMFWGVSKPFVRRIYPIAASRRLIVDGSMPAYASLAIRRGRMDRHVRPSGLSIVLPGKNNSRICTRSTGIPSASIFERLPDAAGYL